ncbi:hypothetical protein F6W99_00004 [Mycobacterium tuberculosis]|nr:hypothetical protein F6W99_00004 [Mycobacterium tuberculosis]
MIIRLESPHRVAFFTDVEMVALLTENAEGADDFIQRTLGNLESASPALKTTLLTFINQQCNASRAARLLFTHRNTLMNRLETAQRLLPALSPTPPFTSPSHSKPSSGGRSKPAILRQRKSRMAPRCVSKTAQHRPLRYGSSTTEPTVLRASRS